MVDQKNILDLKAKHAAAQTLILVAIRTREQLTAAIVEEKTTTPKITGEVAHYQEVLKKAHDELDQAVAVQAKLEAKIAE